MADADRHHPRDGARGHGDGEPGSATPVLRKLLKTELYPYQADGALFVVRAGRCLIGDEMGLGKTVQAIAAVELFARHFGAERMLIVCPTSLKHQWQREFARFTDRRSQVIGGLRAAREAQYADYQLRCPVEGSRSHRTLVAGCRHRR